jgi:hypothetical protein
MQQRPNPGQRGPAADEFNQRQQRADGLQIIASLCDGLDLLRDSLYLRLHQELENVLGTDSLLTPVSEVEAERRAQTEIELYQVVESAAVVSTRGYLRDSGNWYTDWLTGVRLAQSPLDEQRRKRLAEYGAMEPDARRLAMTNVLVAALPETRRAPLVLFRLFPLAAQIVTALAFGDRAGASRIRTSQREWLPAVDDCSRCRGQVLDNGQQCELCGNPLWKTTWLMAT